MNRANGGGVKEVSPEGEVVWEYTGANSCYGCQPLPNGNVLIADFGGGRAVEVNREKEVVWEHKEGNICDAFRLPNGNTLITTNSRFVELTPDKEEVWKGPIHSAKIPKRPPVRGRQHEQ